MITKDELAAMIAALESQPHLSLREERYLAVMKYAERPLTLQDIDAIVLPIDPEGLEEDKHYIEHAIYTDRERIRSALIRRFYGK